MSEYKRDKKGIIQADLAYRLGKALENYHYIVEENNEKYEVTLTLSILQTLLTNCMELLSTFSKGKSKLTPFYSQIPDDDDVINLFNLPKESIITNNLIHGTLRVEKVLREIRNALSHPTGLNLSGKLLSTGYTTTNSNSGKIEKVIFVASPDVTNKIKTKFCSEDSANKILADIKKNVKNPDAFELIKDWKSSRFAVIYNGDFYHRIFHIELTPKQLRNLTYAISSYLSQPLNSSENKSIIEYNTKLG